MVINYLTEPVEDFGKAVNSAKSKSELIANIKKFQLIAYDALKVASKKDFNFKEFATGLAIERKREYAGREWNEKYGAILLPMVMFQTSMVAFQFGCPWGTAYIRLKDIGKIVMKNGHAEYVG